MKIQMWRFATVFILVGIFLLLIGYKANVSAQEPEPVFITNPADGATVTGQTIVTGAVDFSDFMKYEVFLKTGDHLAWVATGYAPVINGNLARLDSRLFLDGVYQLVIRKVNTDSNYTDFLGPTITIANGLGAPLAEPEIDSSFLYPPAWGSLFRIRNCSGNNLEFDYKSRQGFCSAQDLWIMPKLEHSPLCSTVDILLIPCPYEGSSIGQGEKVGATYSFTAEEGKIYQFIYVGDSRFYLGEIAGDERAENDTGGVEGATLARSTPIAADTSTTKAAAQPATTAPTSSTGAAETLLPVSGQGRATNLPFIGVAFGLILLLIIGGVIAVRKRGYSA